MLLAAWDSDRDVGKRGSTHYANRDQQTTSAVGVSRQSEVAALLTKLILR
jgi:hypothetical protein